MKGGPCGTEEGRAKQKALGIMALIAFLVWAFIGAFEIIYDVDMNDYFFPNRNVSTEPRANINQ